MGATIRVYAETFERDPERHNRETQVKWECFCLHVCTCAHVCMFSTSSWVFCVSIQHGSVTITLLWPEMLFAHLKLICHAIFCQFGNHKANQIFISLFQIIMGVTLLMM